MRKGFTAIVSVCLLAALAIMGAVSLIYWVGGAITSQSAAERALPITVVPIANDFATLKVMVANTGTSTIPAGTVLRIAENGVSATLEDALPPTNQRQVTFIGYSDGTPRFFPTGTYTVYASRVGQAGVITVASEAPVILSPISVSPNANNDYNPCLEEAGGDLYIAWDSDRLDPGGDYEVLVANSTNGSLWANAVQVSDSQSNKNPSLEHNGTHFGIAWDMTNPSNEHIFTKESAAIDAWSSKKQAENENNRNREPSMIMDSAGDYFIAWASQDLGNYDIYIKKADGFTSFAGNPSTAVDTNASADSYPSLIQDSNGMYWVAFQTDRSGSMGIWVTNSSNATTWGTPRQLPVKPGGVEPSLVQDSNGRYWLTYHAIDGIYDYIWLMYSDDMLEWSPNSRVSSTGVNERSPFLMQASGGTYWMAYEAAVGGNWDIYIRSTTNAMYWG
ncbi:MAG: hypothetical protein KAW41_00415 [Candidatus Diapherotrites archaeon]|nr:hypothetical protein [Candidatus Diapherotrites archaeon]